jgi:hypothetical protein
MIIRMMILVASVILGWLALSHQSLLVPALSESVNPISGFTTITVLALGLATAYVLFLIRREATQRLMLTSAALRVASAFLVDGMEFDRVYSLIKNSITRPLVRGAKTVQSGVLGNNVALLLSALVLLVVLIAIGVI